MAQIRFDAMADRHWTDQVVAMMRMLYSEDPASAPPDPGRFPLTIDRLLREPSRGQVVLFIEEQALRGYALLIPYWSNEFGGTLLFIDELFVSPEARSRGIAHLFFEYLNRERPFEPVALALEVTPANLRGKKLYDSLGFQVRKHSTMIRPLDRC